MAFRAPVLAALFLIISLATLAMPGLGQLRRRDPDPVRHLRERARLRAGGERRRGAGRRLHDPALPADDARPGRARRSSRVRSTALNLAAIVPLVAVIVALGVYPQLRACTAPRRTPRAAIAKRGPPPSARAGDAPCTVARAPMSTLLAAAHVHGARHRLQGALAPVGARGRLGDRADGRPVRGRASCGAWSCPRSRPSSLLTAIGLTIWIWEPGSQRSDPRRAR